MFSFVSSSFSRRFRAAALPVGFAALLSCLAGVAHAQAPTLYRVTDLGSYSTNGVWEGTYANGINASGQVTGYSITNGTIGMLPTPPIIAFRTGAGGMIGDAGTALGTLGGKDSRGFAINASGQVVGFSDTVDNLDHAFRTTATGLISDPGTDLGTLGGMTYAYGINDSGQTVGMSWLGFTSTAGYHAFRTTATGLVSDAGADLGTLGGTKSSARGINNRGQTIGSAFLAGDTVQHAFRTTATGLISDAGADLGSFGGWSSADAINASGQTVGSSYLSGNSGISHAFRTTATGDLTEAGADLGVLSGGTSASAYAINNAGVTVGVSTVASGKKHAFYVGAFSSAMYDLNDYLDPVTGAGWTIQEALSINDDGVIVGDALFGVHEHAIRLTPISAAAPEPTSIALLATGIGLPVCFARRRRTAG